MRLRSRHLGVAAILLATAGGALTLVHADGGRAETADLPSQIEARMRTTLEQSNPQLHNHAGHQQGGPATVVCGVRVYGYEPAQATTMPEVRTVYGFHLCGMAEPGTPWDVAVKLAGPVILDMTGDPPGIRVVEATEDVRFVDRLRQMFPTPYAEMALKEALTEPEMSDLRRRYADAARP